MVERMTVERRERLKASVMKRETPTVEQGLELIEALEWADRHIEDKYRVARVAQDMMKEARHECSAALDFICAHDLKDEYENGDEDDDDEDGGVVGAFMSATTVRDINAGGLP